MLLLISKECEAVVLKKSGFTMAELIIGIGIIGIIVAIALPALQKQLRVVSVGPALSKSVSAFENANKKMLYDRGTNRVTLSGITNAKDVFSFNEEEAEYEYISETEYVGNLSQYMDITIGDNDYRVNNYGNDNAYAIHANTSFSSCMSKHTQNGESLNGAAELCHQTVGAINQNPTSAQALVSSILFKTKDGTLYAVKVTNNNVRRNELPNTQKIGFVHIDVNGYDSPNKIGKDVFAFTLWNDGSIRPIGSTNWNGGANDQSWRGQCDANGVTDGMYCAGSIFENDMKVIYE